MGPAKSGIALITAVVFVILVSILAIASINLMANQALLIEHQVRRIRGFYAAEAAINKNLLRLFSGLPVENSTVVGSIPVSVTFQHIGNEPMGTTYINSLVANATY